MYPYIVTEESIQVFLEDRPFVVHKESKYFEPLLKAIKKDDKKGVDAVCNALGLLKTYLGKSKDFVIDRRSIYYKDEKIQGPLVDRMLKAHADGLSSKPFQNFFKKLMKNPSYNSRQQLYGFLEACDLPVTEDGNFLAYKAVKEDYFDVHTGKTFENRPGAVIEIPRHLVDDNPSNTCSHGLHVCSRAYGKFGPRLMLVEVDPADVVSVPNEYHNAKMRVCKYVVKHEIEEFFDFNDTSVYTDDEY